MSEFKCPVCQIDYANEEIVIFDEFGQLELPRIACKYCFITELKKGLNNFNPGNCEVCEEKLIPCFDEVDDIFDEKIVWYQCPKFHENEEKNHTSIGEYILQPIDDGVESGKNG